MKKLAEDRSWSFLVASPKLDAPIFDESVVLVLEDSAQGAFGVILNKPTGRSLEDIDGSFSKYGELRHVELFEGGPISKEKLSIAVWYDDGSELGNFSFGLTPEKAEKILSEKPNAQAAAFAGYSGWSPGQLDMEIEDGSWLVCAADLGLLNDLNIEELWEELVIRDNPVFEKFPDPPANPTTTN